MEPTLTARARVLQVVLGLNPGGTERLVVELVKRLQPEVPMAVCCLDEKGAWAEELEDVGITVHALRRPAGFTPALGRMIARHAAEHQATVLHCHHYSPFVYGCLARAWRPKSRVLFTEHGRLSDAPPSRKRRCANLLFARIPHAVFTVSEDLRQHILHEGFAPSAVKVIYNGIDIGDRPDSTRRADVRQRLGISDQTLVIGTIARLDPVKDLATLIRALSALNHRLPAILVVIGDGTERSHLEQTASALGVLDRVRFLGHRDDARVWLIGCDVYANTSISEGVSLTILEAMAAALPVVATRVGGTPEVVDESCGRLIAPRDPDVALQALTELGEDSSLRDRLGAAARQRVEARFSLTRMIGEYRDVYSRLS